VTIVVTGSSEDRRLSVGGCKSGRSRPVVNPWVDARFNPSINPCSDDTTAHPDDHRGMSTSDYLLNALFVFLVLRQAYERRLDVRSALLPLVIVFVVARQYVHSIPTAGNDLVLIGLLTVIGIGLGILSGLATHVRRGDDGTAYARIGWLGGALLIGGFCARMVFVLAVNNGAEPAIRSFSIAHQIGAAAWPVALLSMALCEVSARVLVLQVRRRQLADRARESASAPVTIGVGA
jgi:hypothetical protein